MLDEYEPDTHLYYCGPPGMMEAVAREAKHWPKEAVHCEYFVPPPPVWPQVGRSAASAEFSVRVSSTGVELPVPRDLSIVEVLRQAGIDCATSCEAGVCGTCRTRYLEGTPEHHDYVLSDEERGSYVMICCARASSEVLVLDI